MRKLFIQKNKITIKTLLTAALFLICFNVDINASTPENCELPENWNTMTSAQDNDTKVAIDLDVQKINLNQPFSFKISLCNQNGIVSDRITANAIMPAHQHGMNYTPSVMLDKESKMFNVDGFLFHMPGQWEITISNYQGDEVTHHTKTITIN